MKTAVLVIDVQQALCTGEWAAFDIDAVVDRINAVISKSRAVGAPVLCIQHEEEEGPLAFDTEGWQLYGRLNVEPCDIRVRKTAPDSFHRTELQSQLQSRGITDLVICGLQSEFCVDSTVRGALAHGYPVVLVADGHSTLNNSVLTAAEISAHHNATLANLGGLRLESQSNSSGKRVHRGLTRPNPTSSHYPPASRCSSSVYYGIARAKRHRRPTRFRRTKK